MVMRQFITLTQRNILLEYPVQPHTKYRACSNKLTKNTKNSKNHF